MSSVSDAQRHRWLISEPRHGRYDSERLDAPARRPELGADANSMQLRVLATARSSGDAFDLRCEIREKLIDFLQRELPDALPRQR